MLPLHVLIKVCQQLLHHGKGMVFQFPGWNKIDSTFARLSSLIYGLHCVKEADTYIIINCKELSP
jgi:hypothetical protein